MNAEGKFAGGFADEAQRLAEGTAGQGQAEMSAMVSMEGAVAASREFVHRFWNADTQGCAAMLAEDFVWVGADADQFGAGTDAFAQVHGKVVGQDARVILMNEEYRAIPSGGARTVVVICQYRGFTGLAFTTSVVLRHRLTFVWRASPEGLRLVHCHLSEPAVQSGEGERPEGASFMLSANRCAFALFQRGVDEPVEIRDVDGGMHFIRQNDVLYLEARRQSTVVHCTTGQFRLREGIGRVIERIDPSGSDLFAFTHRSFVVNVMYVACVGRDTVTMANGDELSLSSRRRDEVLAQVGRVQKAC